MDEFAARQFRVTMKSILSATNLFLTHLITALDLGIAKVVLLFKHYHFVSLNQVNVTGLSE